MGKKPWRKQQRKPLIPPPYTITSFVLVNHDSMLRQASGTYLRVSMPEQDTPDELTIPMKAIDDSDRDLSGSDVEHVQL